MAGAPRPSSTSWRPILLLLLIAPLLLGLVALLRAGSGVSPIDPGVDWAAYPPDVHRAVDNAAKNASCAGLAEQREWATTHATGSMDPGPLVAYIDSIRRQLVCPG